MPSSKLGSTASWAFFYMPANYSYPTYYFANAWATNIFQWGGGTSSAVAVLKPDEAWNIDTKLDDGKPGLGSVLSYQSVQNPGCTLADATTTDYNLAGTSIGCSFIMKLK